MLDIFEMIRSNGEHTKEYVHEDVDIFEVPNGCQGNQVLFIMVEET
jgi:hypothetical protein